MKDKIKQFMYKGGITIIIATLALGAYLLVMHMADNFFQKTTEGLKIAVEKSGELSINYNGDNKENVYILWETDGGSLTPNTSAEIFKNQFEKKDNKWYYANTLVSDSVKWKEEDADGNKYVAATVRAILYEKSENKDQYNMENYITEVTITISRKGDFVVQAEKRYFSNPIREDGKEDWNQIYIIEENNELITYRYRTGQKIEDADIRLYWESDEEILYQTAYKNGLYPNCSIEKDAKGTKKLTAINDVSVLGSSKLVKVKAYLAKEQSSNIVEDNNKFLAILND